MLQSVLDAKFLSCDNSFEIAIGTLIWWRIDRIWPQQIYTVTITRTHNLHFRWNRLLEANDPYWVYLSVLGQVLCKILQLEPMNKTWRNCRKFAFLPTNSNVVNNVINYASNWLQLFIQKQKVTKENSGEEFMADFTAMIKSCRIKPSDYAKIG